MQADMITRSSADADKPTCLEVIQSHQTWYHSMLGMISY